MLIVIVIIGILAAALIPRLSSARGRANDVARKADLAQVAAALVSYQIDNGEFPVCPSSPDGCNLSDIEDELMGAGMSSIPKDPNASRVVDAGMEGSFTAGEYAYTPIEKKWIPNNGFVVMAATETEWWSNRIASQWLWWSDISASTEFSDIVLCESFEEGTNENNDGICWYVDNEDVLRYIYVY